MKRTEVPKFHILISSLLLSLILICSAFASPVNPTPFRERYDERKLWQFYDSFKKLDDPAGYAPGVIPGRATGPEACVDAYHRLYQKGFIDIRIFVGYYNDETDPGHRATDRVYDDYVKAEMAGFLVEPCQENIFACGFKKDPQSEKLIKQVIGPNGSPLDAEISIEASSVGESDRENRHQLRSEQKQQSRKIEANFLESLGEADVVIYAGHARKGTGPGFKPLSILGWATAWLFKPSRHHMLKALREAKHPPALIGVLACNTDQYYRKYLAKNSANTGLVLTPPHSILEENHGTLLGMLNSVLGMKCGEDFQKSLPQAKLYGFFSP